ncbi:NAD-dependent epimerase/dehydratase family protein [Ramlibacter terrae]|uniref:NAD-dependent epimerase/dehydratase family protein n=1 Tax=Ramlibacter terrae TaxID=2732511 RepID=A0ABX6P4Z3_9BURK|nr:NAD-dependent epimerase/dehydratase family protein [Ramlibacter terrae]
MTATLPDSMQAEIRGKTWLITGGASLIGSHIADQLLQAGAGKVRLFDNFSLGSRDNIAHLGGDDRVELIKGDVLSTDDLARAFNGVTGVFALAGFLTLPMANNPHLGLSVNVIGLVNTLDACKAAGVRRIVLSSSVSAYGNSTAAQITEETPFTAHGLPAPSQMYGTSKLLGEALCAQYARAHGLQFNALRFSSVYGERQHARAVNALFIAQTLQSVLKDEPPVIVGDGSEVHDYIYVTDVARGCLMAMAGASHGHVLNIATGVDTTLTRVVELVLQKPARRRCVPNTRKTLARCAPLPSRT